MSMTCQDPNHRRNASGRCLTCKAAQMRDARLRDPESYRVARAAYREANRDKIRRQERARRQGPYGDVLRQRDRDRYSPTYERQQAQHARYMQRRSGGDLAFIEYSQVLLSDPCSYCGAPTAHVDHIVATGVGGENAWDNLTAACGPCNHRKWKLSLLDFLTRERSRR
jgi:5-methylcytosine-specific restriction endonuclease McrA